MQFDGKKIRDEILKGLADKIVLMKQKPILAEILIGSDPVSKQYAELKKKMAEKTGIIFNIYTFSDKNDEQEITECIDFLNCDEEVNGIMIQIPVAKKFDRDKLISAISSEKDVDGLRFCLGIDSKFKPPVVLAILEALFRANVISTEREASGEILKNSQDLSAIARDDKKIAIVGKGFLVGSPLIRALSELGVAVDAFDRKNNEAMKQLNNYDVIVSATGKAGIIKPEMIKEGVVLIDAGTAEENGELKGDIDPKCYKKASYYTPVPGGIGPVTVAMLFQNLVSK